MSERSPEGRHGNPLQYSCLQNSMDRGAWWARVDIVTKSQTQLKRLECTHTSEIQSRWVSLLSLWLGQEDSLKREMATHSIILVWEIPQTEKSGELQSTGSQRSQT